MLYYTITDLAQKFTLSRNRLQTLIKKGKGPKRSKRPTDPNGAWVIETADALAWAEAQIERLKSEDTEQYAEKYVLGSRRLRAEEYIAHTQSPTPKLMSYRIKRQRRGPGREPTAWRAAEFPATIKHP